MAVNPAGSPLQSRLLAECRAALLDALLTALRDLGYQNVEGLDAAARAAGESFDELAGLRDRRGFEAARGLTASRISLVHEEDLEFTIRLTDFARRLRDRCEGPLGKLHLRFMTLLLQTDAAAEQMPAGPETVCCGLRGLSDGLQMTPAERLAMLERIEAPLAHRFGMLYTRLNQLLDEQGIAPYAMMRAETPPARQPAPERAAAGNTGSAATPQPVGALGELQRALLARMPAAPSSPMALDPGLSAALLDRVLGWLGEQQNSGGGSTQRLGASELGGLLAPPTRAAVEAIERVFEYIMAHPRLPTVGKAALARLRVPLLKLALLEPALMSNPDHPARQLINAMGACCLGLPVDLPPDHPVSRALGESSNRVQRLFDRDPAPLAAEVPRLDGLRAVRLTAVRERAAQFVAAAGRIERDEMATRFACRAVRALESESPPQPVCAFIEDHWLKVLVSTLLQHGDKSAEWRTQLMVADRLIWSAQPKSEPEDRARLLKLLPELLRRIHAGLAAVGVDEARRNALLSPCMAIHSAALHGRTADVPPTPPLGSALAFEALPDVSGLRVLRMTGYMAREPALPDAAATLDVGDWLELGLPEGRQVRGQIGWVAPSRLVWLLVDPDRQGVLAVTQRALTQQWAARAAHILAEPPLFEQASQAALRNLRG